jgi:hypothetical protein
MSNLSNLGSHSVPLNEGVPTGFPHTPNPPPTYGYHRQAQRQVRAAKVDGLMLGAFIILGGTCLMNLNGITAMAFETNRLMSLVILVSGLYLIYRTSGLWARALGSAGVWFIGFLFTYLAIGYAIEQDNQQLISHLNSIFIIFAGAVTAYHFAQRNATYKLFTILTILAVLGAYTVYLSPFLGDVYAKMQKLDRMAKQGRWMGFFANPNETGMATVLAFACTLTIWVYPSKVTRLKKYLPLIVVGLAIGSVLSFSRSAMITFAFIGVFVAIYSAGMGSRAIGTLLAGFFVFIAAYWFFTSGYKQYEWTSQQEKRIQSVERMLTLGEFSQKDTGGRFEGIKGGLHYWSKSPIFGHGLGMLHAMPYQYFGGLGCHNTHVMVLGEAGILGFSVYFLALVAYLVSTFKIENLPVRTFCLLFFFSAMATGMVGHTMLDARNFNLVFGIAFGLQSYYLSFQKSQRKFLQFQKHRNALS